MTAFDLMMLAIGVSMFLVVAVIGMNASLGQLTYLFRRPGLFARSIFSMNVVMLAFALAISAWLDVPPAIKIGLVGLAISPVPPFLPTQQSNAGGSADYAIGLLAGSALLSIVLVPFATNLLGYEFGVAMHMPWSKIASIVLMTVLVPLLAGILLRRFAPAFATRITRPVSVFANVLLALALIPMLYIATSALWALIGNGVLICLILFTLTGIAVGNWLGGPEPHNRAVLALATGSRHPAIALAIANINFPNEKAVLAVVIYHLVVGSLFALPYVIWRKRALAAGAHAP